MKKKVLWVIMGVVAAAMVIQSCNVNGCNRSDMTSSVDSQDGEKMKGDCMQCHGPNGNGRGCFSVGGTIYDITQSQIDTNAVVMLYTQPNGGGQLVATFDVNKSGNFYTTSVINFGSGLYAAVVSKTSKRVEYMTTSTVSGACGSCHGVLNARIWVN
jgi:cytochrome c553